MGVSVRGLPRTFTSGGAAMKPVYGILLGVLCVSAALPLTAGGLMWWASSSEWMGSSRSIHISHHGELEMTVDGNLQLIEDVPQGPIEPPAGTVPMTVRVTPPAGVSERHLIGSKAVLLVSKKSEKLKKDVVMPVVSGALVLSVESSASATGEMTVSIAVPEEQTIQLLEAMESGVSLQIKLPGCGGWSAHETDTAVFLAPAKSTEELLAFLASE